jgi:hypothetical protein
MEGPHFAEFASKTRRKIPNSPSVLLFLFLLLATARSTPNVVWVITSIAARRITAAISSSSITTAVSATAVSATAVSTGAIIGRRLIFLFSVIVRPFCLLCSLGRLLSFFRMVANAMRLVKVQFLVRASLRVTGSRNSIWKVEAELHVYKTVGNGSGTGARIVRRHVRQAFFVGRGSRTGEEVQQLNGTSLLIDVLPSMLPHTGTCNPSSATLHDSPTAGVECPVLAIVLEIAP